LINAPPVPVNKLLLYVTDELANVVVKPALPNKFDVALTEDDNCVLAALKVFTAKKYYLESLYLLMLKPYFQLHHLN
jgi:hypothetical protein